MPINYITGPFASVSAACFGNGQYEDLAFRRCFSNLLAAGVRRLVVDVYWDARRGVWSLCPVEVRPERAERELAASNSEDIAVTGLGERRSDAAPDLIEEKAVQIRQVESTQSPPVPSAPPVNSANSTQTLSTTFSNTSPVSSPTATGGSSNGTQPAQNGNYTCTPTMQLPLLTSVLNDYLDGTDITTEATLHRLILNVHAAASIDNPDEPAQKPDLQQMPTDGAYLSDALLIHLDDELYTPKHLKDDRNDLNGTWLDVQWKNTPVEGYYNVTLKDDDRATTGDGWPTEAFIEFKEFYRLIAGFGTIDPQMEDYDFSVDRETIFAQNKISQLHDTSFDNSGTLREGCLFTPAEQSVSASPNASFAVSVVSPTIDFGGALDNNTYVPAVANLTACGLSPFLNTTLGNKTADEDPIPYLTFSRSTLWSWAPNEPQNGTDPDDDSNRPACTVMSTSEPYPGRWRSVTCSGRRRVACQGFDQPYTWRLSSEFVFYSDGDTVCPSGFAFSVPRTPLENSHLLSTLRSSNVGSDPVYLNFNSLDVAGCWVRGTNATCPYTPRLDANRTRVVVVPAVAAVIIFVLAALTIFVKCASNRRETRRGKRRARRLRGEWEYEGVPS